MHTLAICNPGHFHAALTFRKRHPSLSDQVYVYSDGGPELDKFKAILDSYNSREKDPTDWRLHVYTGPDYLERMIAEKKGDLAILAGKNNTKIAQIDALSEAGFNVLSDKPLVVTKGELGHLAASLGPDRPPVMDIMTERYEITTILQKEFMAVDQVFGEPLIPQDGSPAISKTSLHHLYKLVNNKPLVRPPWYFDVGVQGEGIVDVSTHVVDMTHWMLFPGQVVDYDSDIELLQARRWPTKVPLDRYRLITGDDSFPEAARADVDGDVLNYFCNGEFVYRVKGVPVHIRVVWNLEPPPGGGDTHESIVKGTKSDLLIRQVPERNFLSELLVAPKGDKAGVEKAVQGCLEAWAGKYPELSLADEGEALRIDIPAPLRTTHEQHHSKVRDEFIGYLDHGGMPDETGPNILSRYTLLNEARELALASPLEPLE